MNPEPANAPLVARRRGSYFTRHWRGELSLLTSFLLNLIALSVVISPLAAFVAGLIGAHFQRQPGLAVILIEAVFAVPVCILVWSVVGAWRAARRYAGLRVWSVLARIVMVCWFALIVVTWIGPSYKLITTHRNCTTGRDFGELTPFFEFGPCEVAWYEKHGLVVRRLGRQSSFGGAVIDIFR